MFIVKKGKKVGIIDGENGKVIAPAIYDQYEMFGSKGNHYRRWTLDDLVEACPEVLYYAKGKTKGVPLITIQNDIQIMRSDKLGYNAPIEVYEHKYYRYADKDYSITNMPMSHNDFEMMQEAVDMLRQLEDFEVFAELPDIIGRLQDKLAISRNKRKPIKISTVCRT